VDEPESGWPVVIFLNGTGGDYRDFCDSNERLEVARRLGQAGIVGMGIDLPLQGSRPGADTAGDLQHFNVVIPVSARTNFRQGAADALVLAHALADRSWTFEFDGVPILRTDPERIMLMGHSQGGLHAALAAPFIGNDSSAVVLSGTGGQLAITILERKDPFDFAALVSSLLFLDADELSPLHPAIGLVQTLVDVTDPVNYAPYWSSVRGPWAGHTPVPVLVTSGTDDNATPYQTSVALAAAARLPAVSDEVLGGETLVLRGCAWSGLPAADNAWGFDGLRRTLGFAQFEDGSHWVVFQEQPASDLYVNWLSSTAAGDPALWILDR
jgi:pimeloyl-ACP methyl ester carboxylesterase